MANYPWATRFPARSELRRAYSDQTLSSQYREFTVRICRKADISIDNLVATTIDYLESPRHQGVEDLAVFMCFLIQKFKLDFALNSQTLYKAVKGIPHHSQGRIGYTFERKGSTDRGVFLFLR